MRVKEVVYSRLFTIGDFNNERIGFKVELDDNDDPERVLGLLVEKVLAIEDTLALYRELLRKVETYEKAIENAISSLRRKYEILVDLEVERVRLDNPKNERERCRLISIEDEIEDTISSIETIKDEIKSYVGKYNESLRLLRSVRDLIVKGQIPESIVNRFVEKDAEQILNLEDLRFKELKKERNIDVDVD